MGKNAKGQVAQGKPPAKEASSGQVNKEQVTESQGPSVDDLFATLDRHVKNDDFKNVVKVADQSILVTMCFMCNSPS